MLKKEKETKNRRREREKLEINKKDLEERNRKKRMIRDQNKKDVSAMAIGHYRKSMVRSKKPALKRKRTGKRTPTEAEKDFKRYVGDIGFVEPKSQLKG